MSYRIEFIPEAVEDYQKLDGSARKKVDKKIEDLRRNPFLGQFLGKKFNIDLSGFYKIYVDRKKIRMIYRITSQEIEIVEIWGIGKREKAEIYRIIGERLKRKKT